MEGRPENILLDGAYWGLESSRDRYDPSDRTGYSRNFIRGVFSRFESGLGGLSDGQARMLENHGYLVADSAIATRVAGLVSDADRPIRVPHPDWMDQRRD